MIRFEKENSRLPLAIIELQPKEQKENLAVMSEDYLKELLFVYFESKPECFFKEIQSYFDQPINLLKRVLFQICDIKKFGLRQLYSLKKIYRHRRKSILTDSDD